MRIARRYTGAQVRGRGGLPTSRGLSAGRGIAREGREGMKENRRVALRDRETGGTEALRVPAPGRHRRVVVIAIAIVIVIVIL